MTNQNNEEVEPPKPYSKFQLWRMSAELKDLCGIPEDRCLPVAETLLTIGYRLHPTKQSSGLVADVESLSKFLAVDEGSRYAQDQCVWRVEPRHIVLAKAILAKFGTKPIQTAGEK